MFRGVIIPWYKKYSVSANLLWVRSKIMAESIIKGNPLVVRNVQKNISIKLSSSKIAMVVTDLLFNSEELEISDDPDNPDPSLGGWDVCRTAAESSTFVVTLIYTNQPPQATPLSPITKIINNKWAIEKFSRDAVSNEKAKEEAIMLLQDSWEIARTGGAPYRLLAILPEDAISYVDAQNVGLRWDDLSCILTPEN